MDSTRKTVTPAIAITGLAIAGVICWRKTMYDNFNTPQREAIRHMNGPCLTIAGPGSGKTTVIVARIQHLIQNGKISPSNILVITFTKAAATEMKQRFLKLTGRSSTDVLFGTFHAVFFMILRYAYGYQSSNILQEEQRLLFLKEIIHDFTLEYEDEAEFLSELTKEISLVKNEEIPLTHYYSKNCPEDVFRSIFGRYQEMLLKHRLLDFDDMMVYCKELLLQRKDILEKWQRKFQYLLVDEFQDINKIQYEIVRLLCKKHQNLFVVGDDDQSIYRFRGAKPEIMLNFPKDYPDCHIVTLDVNYRCSGSILDAADRLIRKNSVRFQKNLRAEKEQGKEVTYRLFQTPGEEYDRVVSMIRSDIEKGGNYSDFAILYRTHTQPRRLAEKFIEYNLPFEMKDFLPNIYDHWISRDLLTYFCIAHGSKSRKDFLQIINRPNRYIKREYLDGPEISLDDLADVYEQQDWMQERVLRLKSDLVFLSRLSPYSGINFIRQGMKYDEYLKEYAQKRKISLDELMEPLDELMDAAKDYKTYEEWLKHIEQYRKDFEEQQKKTSLKKTKPQNQVSFMTMHSAKGLEFQKVFIIDANEEITPHKKSVSEAEIEEERRMFYVAMTRAKKELNIFSVKERFEKTFEVSRFVKESIGKEEPMKTEQGTVQAFQIPDPSQVQAPKEVLTIGERVRHKKFGAGTVQKIEDEKVAISFEKNGKEMIFHMAFCLSKGIITKES